MHFYRLSESAYLMLVKSVILLNDCSALRVQLEADVCEHIPEVPGRETSCACVDENRIISAYEPGLVPSG